MKNKKVLLIGETCLDIFIYGTCDRLNPEAPTPVFKPNNGKSITSSGMAGNVSSNLKHIGVDLDMITNGESIKKYRYVDSVSNYILLRVDEESEVKTLKTDLIIRNLIEQYDAVVISDYNKGLLSERFLEDLFLIASSKGIPTFMDTKKIIGKWANNCSFIKINEKEYNDPKHNKLLKGNYFKPKVIVTMGAKGSMWDGKLTMTKEVQVRDVVGAGDTYLAGLVYGYLETGEIENGIMVGNKLASSVVSKKGVALPDKELL